MAEEKVVEAPDIDAMSDTEVADLKKTMREAPKQEPETDEGEPAPAEKAKPAADKEDGDKEQDFVPHGQFHRERERRKEAERLSQLATQRLAELLEASKPQPQQQAAPQDPDPEPDDSDPVAQLAWARRRLRNIEGHLVGQQQISAQEKAANDAVNLVDMRMRQKQAERPELQQATQYLVSSLAREFAVAGVQGLMADGNVMPQSPLHHAMDKHIRDIALWCYQNQVPVEDYYENLAKARGWQPTPADQQQQSQQQQNGVQQPRDDAGRFAKEQADKIDQLEATKRKAKSLGGAGAPVDLSEVTPETLVNMSDEDFVAFKKKYGEKAMRRAFGAVH